MLIKAFVIYLLAVAVRQTECVCSTQLGKAGVISDKDIKTSSGLVSSNTLTDGWCADSKQNGAKWIEIDLGVSGMGISGVIVAPQEAHPQNYPKNVLVQYVPAGDHTLVDFPFPDGKLEVVADKATVTNITFTGLPASKIRFVLNVWNGDPCMRVDVTGCTITELCGGVCQNNGVCLYENTCQCQGGYTGNHCEIKPCVPEVIPLTSNMITVSSEDSFYTLEQLPKGKGWCPSSGDRAPWVEIKLNKPQAISVFNFNYIDLDKKHTEKQYMRDFELQYIPPTDSSKMYRTFATDIPAMNGSHYFLVTTNPSMVTKSLRIVPSNKEKRACFKLEMKGCDPKGLCRTGFCQNGGTCMGENVCLCPAGFYGDNCHLTKQTIESYNVAFKRIENKIVSTATLNFVISGTVTLQTTNNVTALSINGPGSFITLDPSKLTTSCITDIDHCTSGFTFGIDVNFGSLLDNTFIVSSGGNLPGYKGMALYFQQNHLIYTVSTSTQIWTLQVKYQPVLHKWQRFEVTWNPNLGIGILLDGHLLGTFGRPAPAQATKKLDLCIGCSHRTNNIFVDMLVKGIQAWAIDRTNLVKAQIAKPPATPETPLTAQPPTSTRLTPSTKTAATTTRAPTTTQPPPTTRLTTTVTKAETSTAVPFHQYNLTFQSIIGNILITPAFNFTVHGHPVLNLQEKGQTALVLNGSKQYVELPDKGIPCLEDIGNCTNGFTMKLEVKFTHIDVTKKTYILSSGGDKSGSSGTALYMQSYQLIFAVKQGVFHWVGTCNITDLIQLSAWYSIELSWSMKTGATVVINGKKVIEETAGKPYPGTAVTHPVLIGKTQGANYTAFMLVRNLFTWTASREILVSHGVVPALTTKKTTAVRTTELTTTTTVTSPTTTTATTTQSQTTTAKPSTSTTSTTTTTAKPSTSTTTTPSTTTELPVVEYVWNFTNITQTNTVVGNKYSVTVHGTTGIKDGGISIQNSSQYIDFGKEITCLTNPDTCHQGFTVQFTIKFGTLKENTYLLTSGGESTNGIGLAIVYRYGRFQFILSTTTVSWFTSCSRDKFLSNAYHNVMVSWHGTKGLDVFVDNRFIDSSKVTTKHEASFTTVSNVYFGKPHFTTSTVVKVDYLIQSIHIWYARLEILIQKGICKPPVEATTTTVKPTKQTTSQQPTTTAAVTRKQTPKATTRPSTQPPQKTTHSPLSTRPTTQQQCPAGCISIGSSTETLISTTSPLPMTSAAETQTTAQTQTTTQTRAPVTATSNSKPTTTTGLLTPPPPNTATPALATTSKRIPDYHETPSIHALVGKDKNAYLACLFKGATDTDVVLTVSLLINDTIVLTQSVPGHTGIAMFSVAKLNDNLFLKKIRCSLKASFSGSSLMTTTTFSNIFIPMIKVTPSRLTVTEGHSAERVTVTSTAPPQFYCCKSCKGVCQIHIVTSWNYDRHDIKCNKQVIAQAVIGSTKPDYYNKYICGFALTINNWNQGNKIPVKATIDGRRDGDHHNSLSVTANVYKQPVGVQITGRPTSFHVATVQVQVKDSDRRTSTCKSVNDPHITTFDGLRYNNMNEGQYTLYKHKSLPFEVRASYKKCSSRSHATCNCAVAVKSGDDVITVTGCQDTSTRGHGIGHIIQQLFGHHNHGHHQPPKSPMTIQMYTNGELTPGTIIRRYGCGQKFEIELPTGTVITVQQSYKPFINVWIRASSTDWQNTEGLCGSYDGSRTNDLKLNSCTRSCTTAFIKHWKVSSNSNFFYGVAVSSEQTGRMYCSCVQGKEPLCSPGLGVMKCTKSRYDVTAVLVQQAKRPILIRRSKRQAEVSQPEIVNTTVDPSIMESGVTLEEAEDFCRESIMNSTVTKSCTPIISSNISDRIEDCAQDYNATGLKVWALDHIRDIAFDCVNEAQALVNASNANNSTNMTAPDVEEILANTCVDICVHGLCENGICECDAGFSGEVCDISKTTKPTVASVPDLCDISQTTDCKLAVIYGNNFVNSDDLKCHYSSITVEDTITSTGTTGTSVAAYISLNQVACLLPSLHSATIKISNDGTTLSDSSAQYIVYNSVCHNCYLVNGTGEPTCERKDNNCMIDGVCYAAHETSHDDACQVCLPDHANDTWSASNAADCIGVPLKQSGDSEGMKRTEIIILAVVCAVFGAVVLFGVVYICRKRANTRRKNASADYEVTSQPKLHRDDEQLKPYKDEEPSTAIDNPIYNHRL